MKQLETQDAVRGREKHTIVVAATPEAAYALCCDLTMWPRFMPAVTDATVVVPRGPDSIEEIELTAEANDAVHTWRSARRLDDSKLSVTFARLDPVAPLLRMNGVWEFTPGESEGTALVTLRHRFVATDVEAADFFTRVIRSNATRDLVGMRDWFARGTS